MDFTITMDAQAVLLLCGTFGKADRSALEPLGTGEFNELCEWLDEQQLRPGDLIDGDAARRLGGSRDEGGFRGRGVSVQRIARLLDRGAAMNAALERWSGLGVWVMSRFDNTYPDTLLHRLMDDAPPLLYGAGDPELLAGGGLAISGSYPADEGALAFATRIGRACGERSIQVVAGGLRGVEQAALRAAIAAGGSGIAVLTDGIEQIATDAEYAAAIREDRLTPVSPSPPEAGFRADHATLRNPLVYGLAERALVVSAARDGNDTWGGAIENIRRGWVPLFVRDEPGVPDGNRELSTMGGIPLRFGDGEPASALEQRLKADGRSGRQPESPIVTAPAREDPDVDSGGADAVSTDTAAGGVPPSPANPDPEPVAPLPPAEIDLFPIVWPHVELALQRPVTEKELAQHLDLTPAQLRKWLERALAEGKVDKLRKPVRYVRAGYQMRLYTRK